MPASKKYKILEHTADIKFRAFGSDLKEAFENSACALIDVMSDTSSLIPRKEFKLDVKAEDLESLLYDFINEILYLRDSKRVIPLRVSIHDIKRKKAFGWNLKATLYADNITKADKYLEVKALTYNDMKISVGKKVIIEAVLDI